MKFIEKVKNFWKVTLGPDYPEEQIEIENSTDPEMKELRESLNRVKLLEQKQNQFEVTTTSQKSGKNRETSNQFEVTTTSPKGGKGRGSSNQVVETVEISQKAVREAMQKTAKRETTIEDREI